MEFVHDGQILGELARIGGKIWLCRCVSTLVSGQDSVSVWAEEMENPVPSRTQSTATLGVRKAAMDPAETNTDTYFLSDMNVMERHERPKVTGQLA
ncbi:hypothetical protein VCV18_004437 [Metarhizium anisopliae]